MGKWYNLINYVSFFQKSSNYNTTAQYVLREDGSVDVTNRTYDNGTLITSHGIAKPAGKQSFHVVFDTVDVAQFAVSEKKDEERGSSSTMPNYVIRRVFLDESTGKYAFAVVSNSEKDALWVLSRKRHPSRQHYEEVLAFVTREFDPSKFVLTPHYDEK